MFVAKGLSYVEIDQNGGTLSTLAGSGPFKLPLQWMVLTENVQGSITIDNQDNHKLLRLNMGDKSIASNSATTKAITNNNSNGVNLEVDGSGVITQHAYTSYDTSTAFTVSNFTDLGGTAVTGTAGTSKIPYFDTDKNYGSSTFGSSTIAGSDTNEHSGYNTSATYDSVNGLFAVIGGWSDEGATGSNGSNRTGQTYTVPRTGRLHFIIVGGGGGACDIARGSASRYGGGGAGFCKGIVDSVTAGDTVTLGAGGGCRRDAQGSGPGGTAWDNAGGEQAQGGGHGGSSTLSVGAISLTAQGGRGSPSNDSTIGTVDLSAGPSAPSGVSSYDTNDTTECRSGYYEGGDSFFELNGGSGGTVNTSRTTWRPSYTGWGSGAMSGTSINQSSPAPGIAVVWQDPYLTPISGNYQKQGSFSGTISPGGQYSGL